MQNGLNNTMIRVGFILSVNSLWQGGKNYYKNLFDAIDFIEQKKIKPVVICGKKDSQLIGNDWGSLELVTSSAFDRYSLLWWVRKVCQKIFNKDPFLSRLILKNNIDVLSHFSELVAVKKVPIISWIPDFQHVHLPQFFSHQEIALRNKQFQFSASISKKVILSSQNAQYDFIKFCPEYASKAEVLHFSINPSWVKQQKITLNQLHQRYHFNGRYFFLPNQFWAHKNHVVVINALALAIQSNRNIKVICTGSVHDYRQPDYFDGLLNLISTLKLQEHFIILGKVPYQDLIALMQYADAVINPSCFEGWSTTVEESKLLNKMLILSNIMVHKEQSPERVLYFNVDDHEELANHLVNVSSFTQTSKNSISKHELFFESFGVKYQNIVLNTVLDNNH